MSRLPNIYVTALLVIAVCGSGRIGRSIARDGSQVDRVEFNGERCGALVEHTALAIPELGEARVRRGAGEDLLCSAPRAGLAKGLVDIGKRDAYIRTCVTVVPVGMGEQLWPGGMNRSDGCSRDARSSMSGGHTSRGSARVSTPARCHRVQRSLRSRSCL